MFQQWAPFEALVAEAGKGIRVEKVIPHRRSGKKVLVLVKVVEGRSG